MLYVCTRLESTATLVTSVLSVSLCHDWSFQDLLLACNDIHFLQICFYVLDAPDFLYLTVVFLYHFLHLN